MLIIFSVVLVLILVFVYVINKKNSGDQLRTEVKQGNKEEEKQSFFKEMRKDRKVYSVPMDSLAHYVLNSDDFNCDGRKMSDNDAWAWQLGVANSKEGFRNRPHNDNDFSKILAGKR
jgi:hypothetical protein